MASLKKTNQVEDIIELLNKHNNFAFVKYERTTHQSLEKLRKNLKKSNSNIKVVKNTLLEKAINKLSGTNKLMDEFKKTAFPTKASTALLILDKIWDKSLAEFYQFTKGEKTLDFKVGILDNNIYTSDLLKKIAQLPPKEQLIAKVIGSIKAPLNNLVHSMKFNMQKFVYILNEKSKKGGDTNV